MVSKNTLTIFLSGSVKKAEKDDRDNSNFWTDEDELTLSTTVNNGDISLLNPNTIDTDPNDSNARFEKDIELLLRSDLVLVDARTRKGLGIGVEMAIAKAKGIPIYAICPVGTYYHNIRIDPSTNNKIDWVHPFICGLCESVYENLADAINGINTLINENKLLFRNMNNDESLNNIYHDIKLLRTNGRVL